MDGVILSELLAEQVDGVAEALGMTAYRSTGTDVTKNRNFLCVREGGCFRATANHTDPYSRAPRIPPVNVSVALPGVFALVGHHGAFHSWLWRLWEAEGLVPLIQGGRRVVLAADFNEEPVGGTRDFSALEDREYVHSRTRSDTRYQAARTPLGFPGGVGPAARQGRRTSRHGTHRSRQPHDGRSSTWPSP
ncbi:hypothetical protein AB0O31_32030 [Kitasatospora cineracea]|uniref:hypothetical protein n=1 Tax=Kitasatospora cineracea TaxID=88074 RepID=UPI0034128002